MFSKATNRPVLFFDANDGAGGGTTDTDDKGKKKKKDDDPETGDDDSKKKQNDLNDQFADRAKRAAETERKKLLEALGLKDEKEFEDYLKAKKETEDKTKTETQRLADEAKKAQGALEKLKSDNDAALADLQKRIVDTEIKVAASVEVKDKDGKVTRAAFRAEAMSDIVLLVDRSKIEEKDGTISGIDKALVDLAKSKPYLLAEATAPRPGKGSSLNRSNADRKDSDEKSKSGWFNSL